MSATATISVFFFKPFNSSTIHITQYYPLQDTYSFFCMTRFNVLTLQSLTRKMFQHKGCDKMLHKQCHPYGRAHVGKRYKTAKNMCFRTKTSNIRYHGAEAQWQSISQLLVTMFPCFRFHIVHMMLWCLCFHYVSDFHCFCSIALA